jgi:hypothetical protein
LLMRDRRKLNNDDISCKVYIYIYNQMASTKWTFIYIHPLITNIRTYCVFDLLVFIWKKKVNRRHTRENLHLPCVTQRHHHCNLLCYYLCPFFCFMFDRCVQQLVKTSSSFFFLYIFPFSIEKIPVQNKRKNRLIIYQCCLRDRLRSEN